MKNNNNEKFFRKILNKEDTQEIFSEREQLNLSGNDNQIADIKYPSSEYCRWRLNKMMGNVTDYHNEENIAKEAYKDIIRRLNGKCMYRLKLQDFIDGVRGILEDEYAGIVSQIDYNLLCIHLANGNIFQIQITDCTKIKKDG